MRIFIVLVVLAVLGWLFLAQKQQEHQKVVTAAHAPAQTASPRPVSEHNWMKRSLDRASDVKKQVVQQRKEDGTK